MQTFIPSLPLFYLPVQVRPPSFPHLSFHYENEGFEATSSRMAASEAGGLPHGRPLLRKVSLEAEGTASRTARRLHLRNTGFRKSCRRPRCEMVLPNSRHVCAKLAASLRNFYEERVQQRKQRMCRMVKKRKEGTKGKERNERKERKDEMKGSKEIM